MAHEGLPDDFKKVSVFNTSDERLEIDRAKIESLEAELVCLRIDKGKYEKSLAAKDTALATAES